MVALTALGNRIWGEDIPGHRFYGTFLMTIGCWLGMGVSAFYMPIIAMFLYLWRMHSARPWFHVYQRKDWVGGFVRSLWIMPYSLLVSVITWNPVHLAFGAIVAALAPLAYYFSMKYTKSGIPVAELAVGAMVALV